MERIRVRDRFLRSDPTARSETRPSRNQIAQIPEISNLDVTRSNLSRRISMRLDFPGYKRLLNLSIERAASARARLSTTEPSEQGPVLNRRQQWMELRRRNRQSGYDIFWPPGQSGRATVLVIVNSF